jgi:hypothetical protein
MVEELARHFFRRHTIYPFARPFWVALNREWIEEQARLYPGFGSALRAIALEALEAGIEDVDANQVRRALGAVAVVGLPRDVARLLAISDLHGGLFAKDIRAAVYEIEHHDPTG